MRLLVVEDSLADFCLIERALRGEFSLVHATSLVEGLQLAAQSSFDLILLDLGLDDSSGYETFERMSAALPNLPILVLSGLEDDEVALRAVANGAQDFVPKNLLLNYPLHRAARYAIERRRNKVKLYESERFALSTLDSLSAHISILDESGQIVSVNNAWRRFGDANGMELPDHGVGSNYLAACDQAQCGGGEIARAVAVGIRQVIRHEQAEFRLEYPCHSPTEERWFVLRATPFVGDGPTRVVVSHENITSRMIAERLVREQCGLRDAVAGMEQVLGVVGHELRTPLAALRAISEFLVTDGARNTAEADRFLNEISEEVDRMSDTVNNLLEAARLNSGRARWNWSEVDVASAIEDAMASILPLVDSNKVVLRNRVHVDACRMAGDADAIRRLMMNLLSNARKYTSAGSIEVSASPFSDRAGQWIELRVKDTGCGISPEISERLGEAFALNAGVVGHNHVSGTGLGLAICKGIAAAHGGDVRFESTQGQGTTVIVRLRADLELAATGDTVREQSIEELLS